MTQAKHTPGPWRLTGCMTKYVEASIGNGLVQEVCAFGPTEADNGYGEQQEANARLIAAAPDLLEALQEIKEMTFIDAHLDPTRALRIARAAISKATGASND